MSFDHLHHSNTFCYFRDRCYRFTQEYLKNYTFLEKIRKKYGFCTCYEFALLRANPDSANAELEEEEFIDIALNAGFLFDGKLTKYKYTLTKNEGMVYIDMNVGELMKEFKPEVWNECFKYSKTPKSGRMFYALLGYLYPEVKRSYSPRFQMAYLFARDEIFQHIDNYRPCSVQQALDDLPKTTSAGFISIRMTGVRQKKEDVLDFIKSEYFKMKNKVVRGYDSENYCMFAMRGHLSDKTKLKTRPIWMQSAETIIAEHRFSDGLYKQFNKKWFRDRMIHGEGSMRRLRQYLNKDSDRYFTNTDISGWDAFRAVFLHRDFFSALKEKIDMDADDSKLYDYINYKSNIYCRILFPSGWVFKTNGGLCSGSRFTLAQNTLLNMWLSITALYMMGWYDYKVLHMSVLGDDFSIISILKFDVEKFGVLLLKYFGLEIKPEKCFFSNPHEERKFLGYTVKGGFLYKNLSELWPGILYTEQYFVRNYDSIAKSFTRLFSYLILGGISNYEFYEFFMLFLGKYGTWLDKVEYIFDDRSMRMTRVLKDIYNVSIGKFNSASFKKMSLLLSKYVLMYDYELIQIDKDLTRT